VVRIFSLVVLVIILIVAIALFFQVMAGFLLPLFLAVVLVIIFSPVNGWFRLRCKGRDWLAALLTTLSIIFAVLLPICLIVLLAGIEGVEIYDHLTSEESEFDLRDVPDKVHQAAADVGIRLEADQIHNTIIEKAQEWLTPLVVGTTQAIGTTIISLIVMVLSVYYFLLDGPAMIRTVMRLSPLDDKYEQQIIDQFHDLTRAVVLATLSSALVQGILAGIGFYFAGLEAIFLLTLLAMLFAMVPFIGTAAVWVPACLWLLWGGNTAAAIGLAIYCIAIVSMADNLIKPWILHGRSNLHPLLALLSVLGGVQALGPIGIFVGPMVVAFLQTLLKMLQSELEAMDERGAAEVAAEDSGTG